MIAGGSVLSCSRKIMIFLVIYLFMTQLKPHIQADNHLGHTLVGSNLDVKPIYGRNSAQGMYTQKLTSCLRHAKYQSCSI